MASGMRSSLSASTLIERQIAGFNASDAEAAASIYAPGAVLIVSSPHTPPGKEMRHEGPEAIGAHFAKALKYGLRDVELDWLGEGPGFVAWRDHGLAGPGTEFLEAHTALLNDDGQVTEHWIHSIYEK